MLKRFLVPLLLPWCLGGVSSAQELMLSTAAKNYAAGERIWVNLSVLEASAVPGAYKIAVRYDASKVSFTNVLPAEKGPFSITPAAVAGNGTVSVAGFQGVVDSGSGSASLVTLVFTPLEGPVEVDTASFAVAGDEVYSTGAQPMELKATRQTTSVLLPSAGRSRAGKITVTGNYIRFSMPSDGIASVRVFDLNGRTVAVPLAPVRCKTGHHAVPLGNTLRSGIYIVAVRGTEINATKKLEVVR